LQSAATPSDGFFSSFSLDDISKDRYPDSFYLYGTKMRKSFTKSWAKAAEQQKITAIAVPGNDANFAVVHVPRIWAGLRIWCMTSEYYNELKGRQMK